MTRFAPALPLLLAACGYDVGFGAHELGVRTVAIVTVENDTFRQGLDRALTRQLGRDLTQYTGLVPGGPESADARLEVRLRDATGRSISEGVGTAILEGAVLLAVEVRLVERVSGRVLYRNKHADWAEFRTQVGEGLQGALAEATRDLSRRILIGVDRGAR